MTRLTLTVALDIESAIQQAVQDAALSGLGPDGTSEYDITEVAVTSDGSGTYTVVVEVDRTTGKFVASEELCDELTDQLTDLSIDADWSMG